MPSSPAALPNIPMLPAEVVIRQMTLLDTINLAESFFLTVTGLSIYGVKNLLFTLRKIFDGRAVSVLTQEALDLYNNLGLTSITDMPNAQAYDIVIAIADYYVYRSAHP